MYQQFQIWFNRIVKQIEERPVPLYNYGLLFLAILSVRLLLEFISNQKLFTLVDVIHIALWFSFIVGAFIVQLHLFSGEGLRKIIKLSSTCLSISLSAPLIDILIFRGKGIEMNYISVNNLHDIVYAYFTVGGISLQKGATIGIRVEIIILIIGCYNYIKSKQKSRLKAILGSLCIYSVLFMSGIFPFLMNRFQIYLNIPHNQNDLANILLFLVLNTILALFILNKLIKSSHLYYKLNITVFLFYIVCFTSGAVLSRKIYPNNWQLDASTIYYFPLLICISICFLCVYNLSYKSTAKKISSSQQQYLFMNILIILCLSFAISYKVFFLSCILLSITYFLYNPTTYLFKLLWVNLLLEILLSTIIALLGFCSFGGVLIGLPLSIIFIIVALQIMFTLVKSIKNKHQT